MAAEQAVAAPRRSGEVQRWLSIALRSLHLVAVVWLGAAVLAGQGLAIQPALWLLASGLAMLWLDLRAARIALGELAGIVVLAKLALLGWMALDPRQAAWIFWTLLVASSLSSHAPKAVRHWPKPVHKRASSAAKPG